MSSLQVRPQWTRLLVIAKKRPLQNFSQVVIRSFSSSFNDDVPSLYVAATRQHVGKTTVSLALMSGLQKRFEQVGFIKPVGQQALTFPDEKGRMVTIDKDAALFKKYFKLDHVPWDAISPVLIPKGYTRDYLDDKISFTAQRRRIQEAYDTIAANSDVVLCEGTGHLAVGSIVDSSNADVAGWIDCPMVLVVNGGLGRSFDELALNMNFCESYNVPVAGVIVNHVLPEKYEQTASYMQRALKRKWNVPMLGCIPDCPFLGAVAFTDFERLLDGQILSGREHSLRHYRVRRDMHLVACSLEVFLQRLRQQRAEALAGNIQNRRTLFVCHASRNDILLGFLMEAVQNQDHTIRDENDEIKWQASLIVTGCAEHPLSAQVLEIMTALPQSPPVLLTPYSTDVTLEKMYGYTAKLNADDRYRVNAAIQHYEEYINFDWLLERVTNIKKTQGNINSSRTRPAEMA